MSSAQFPTTISQHRSILTPDMLSIERDQKETEAQTSQCLKDGGKDGTMLVKFIIIVELFLYSLLLLW